MSEPNPKVDWFFAKESRWKAEQDLLRTIALECGLTETLKWGQPCYTNEKKNIVVIHSFKEYTALLLFKGAIMKDPEGLLIQQTENVQVGRQMRFTSVEEIARLKPTIKAYLREAVQIEEIGLKVEMKKTSDFPVVEELQRKFDDDVVFRAAFEALTPGRQRGYLLHFAAAKQAKTREARIEKYVPAIMAGKGLMDEK